MALGIDSQQLISNPTLLLEELGRIGSWLQALGVVIVLWLLFQLIAFIISSRKAKEIRRLREDVLRLEKKIDRFMRRR